ncbi:MAG: hypothetical protein M3Q97_08395 [Bacteroidota bacterium]|nr:hypothetical protein [Bacteroidota bacterium]
MLSMLIGYAFTFLFCAIALTTYAQDTYDPFTIFGIGEVKPQVFVRDRAMGGASAARLDSNAFSLNPASYAQLRSLKFEGGVEGKVFNISSGDQRYNSYQLSIPYLCFGIPLTRKQDKEWGATMGLVPYSDIRYIVRSSTDTLGINFVESYRGDGGFTKFYAGTGFRVAGGLYAGFNVNYFFGNNSLRHNIEFPDSASLINTARYSSSFFGDIIFDGGLIYKITLDSAKRTSFSLGANVQLPSNVRGRHETETYTYRGRGEATDTIESQATVKGEMFLPMSIRAGFELKNMTKRWRISGDAFYQPWSQFTYFGNNPKLNDFMGAGLGWEFQPEPRALDTSSKFSRYMSHAKYRFGFQASKTLYEINNQGQPMNYVFSMGLGLPTRIDLRRGGGFSFVDVTLELGKLSTVTPEGIRQNYARLALGFQLFEGNWFAIRYVD